MNKRGFTLIEILAVIVILAILAVLGTTNIFGIKEKAKSKIYEVRENRLLNGAKTLANEIDMCDITGTEIASMFKEESDLLEINGLSDNPTCAELKTKLNNDGLILSADFLVKNKYGTGDTKGLKYYYYVKNTSGKIEGKIFDATNSNEMLLVQKMESELSNTNSIISQIDYDNYSNLLSKADRYFNGIPSNGLSVLKIKDGDYNIFLQLNNNVVEGICIDYKQEEGFMSYVENGSVLYTDNVDRNNDDTQKLFGENSNSYNKNCISGDCTSKKTYYAKGYCSVTVSTDETKEWLRLCGENSSNKDSLCPREYHDNDITVYNNNVQEYLPNGYTQLSYIQSSEKQSGTKYIDTGVKYDDTSIEVNFVGTLETNGTLFGIRRAGRVNNTFKVSSVSNKIRASKYSENYTSDLSMSSSIIYNFILNNNAFIVDGTTLYSFSASAETNNYNLYLFAENVISSDGNSSTAESKPTAKCYSCKIYKNNRLVRNFVPCQNSSNVKGLYDLINRVFYPMQ